MKKNLCALDMKTYNPCILSEQGHGFHEGASICKRNGIYYMVYTDISRGKASCLSYAISQYPLGPYEKKGVIIDNSGCDPQNWNNHGSICEINGQWYVFYHRATHKSVFSRRVCVEPIYFDENGMIKEVEMTVNGQDKEILSTVKMEASRASRLNGSVHVGSFHDANGYREVLTDIQNEDWAEFRYLTFSGENRFFVEVGSSTYGGCIVIHIDSLNGPVIGKAVIENTGGWENYRCFSCSVAGVNGKKAVYLEFKGDQNRLFDIKRFWFE